MSDPTREKVEQWISSQTASETAIDLSVVIPAYNEQWRLPSTLIDIIDYFDAHPRSHEVIVIDDGSSDQTEETVRKFVRIRPQIRLVRLPKNRGKGHAVRTGVFNSFGRLVLFMDADGSTAMSELSRLEEAVNAGAEVAFGSRALPSTDTSVRTNVHRRYLGRLFNFLVNTVVLPGVLDTQCGFKLFTGPAARFIFERQRADRFSFDVEVLLIAKNAGMEVREVAVNWINIPGSKVNLVLDSLKMAVDLVRFRFRHGSVTPDEYANFRNRR